MGIARSTLYDAPCAELDDTASTAAGFLDPRPCSAQIEAPSVV
jgi:hypothetical protein